MFLTRRKTAAVAVMVSLAVAAGVAQGTGCDHGSVAADIDREVDKRLAEAGVPASPVADDAEFLRRVYLDLTGRIPSAEKAAAFLDSKDPDKRRRLIDELLASPQFGQHFATIWRNLIVPANPVKGKAQRDQFTPWLADQFNRGRGWDQVVRELLTAEGDIAKTPPSGFLMANSEGSQPQPVLLAGSAARLFLGVQLRCAECHDHPFAPWKQTDFWGTAAFFSRVRNTGKKGPPFVLTEDADPNPPKQGKNDPPVVVQAPGGAIVIPAAAGKGAGQIVKPRFLGGDEPALTGEKPLRPVFAAWVTSAENPFFARAQVNRVWAQLFGRGLVNPLDDFRDTNTPSHPALLKLLADEFRDSGHDFKHLLRCLCSSSAYQRASRPLPANESDRELFSHMAVKPLSPEAFYDSLVLVLGADPFASPAAKGNTGKGKGGPREPRDEFIQFFKAQGETADESGFNHGIPQFLRRMNGEAFNRGAPVIGRLVRSGASPKQAIESLYLAALSRRPTPDEMELLSAYLSRRADREQGYAGVLWVLLNSGEFVLNR